MDNTKLIETLTKDSWFSVNFQKNTEKKVMLAIGEMLTAYGAGLASWLIPSKISERIDAALKEKEIGEKQHYVGFNREEREREINKIEEKYRRYKKLNNIAAITTSAVSAIVAGKVIGHCFAKAMNDLDK